MGISGLLLCEAHYTHVKALVAKEVEVIGYLRPQAILGFVGVRIRSEA